MLTKSLCAVQALMLSALTVHTIHLERQIRNEAPTIFQYNTYSPAPNDGPRVVIPLKDNNVNLLPNLGEIEEERNNEVEHLNDILGSQAQTSTHSGPDPTLFGPMVEAKPKPLVKSKAKVKTKNLCQNK